MVEQYLKTYNHVITWFLLSDSVGNHVSNTVLHSKLELLQKLKFNHRSYLVISIEGQWKLTNFNLFQITNYMFFFFFFLSMIHYSNQYYMRM
jgi:hypothetical protein